MKKYFDVVAEIDLTPDEIVDIILEMNWEEQAELLNMLALTLSLKNYHEQLECIKEQIEYEYNTHQKNNIKNMFDSFSKYFCEEMGE